jgi:hypothetical protein
MSAIAAAAGTMLAKKAITAIAGKAMTGGQKLGPVLATQALTRMTPSGRASAKMDKAARAEVQSKGASEADAGWRRQMIGQALQAKGAGDDRKTGEMKRLAAAGGLFTSGLATKAAMAGSGEGIDLAGIAAQEEKQRANRKALAMGRIDAKNAKHEAMYYDAMTKAKPGEDQAQTAQNMQVLAGLASTLGG